MRWPWPLTSGMEQGFGDAVDDEVGVAADGRGEVGVAGRGEGEVAFVLLAVAGLLERAQHEVGEDALFGLAGDFGGEVLVHARGDGDGFGDFVLARIRAAASAFAALIFAAVAFGLEFADGEVAEAEGVAEGRGGVFEFDDASGVGRFVDAVERGTPSVSIHGRRTRWRRA